MTERALAKVIVLTKDEHDLIEPFILFYGSIFGYENVHVIDNGSTHPTVLDVYRRFGPLGVHVTVEARPFTEASSFMTEHMHSLRGSCEWILPMETDEFLLWLPSDFSAEKIRGYLASIDPSYTLLKYRTVLQSVVDPRDAGYTEGGFDHPISRITRFVHQGWDKFFVRADALDRVVQWLHLAKVSYGESVVSVALGLLHFSDTGARHRHERAMKVMQASGVLAPEMPLALQYEVVRQRIGEPNMAHGHQLVRLFPILRRLLVLEYFQHMFERDASMDEAERVLRAWTNTDGTAHALIATLRALLDELPDVLPEGTALAPRYVDPIPTVSPIFTIPQIADVVKNIPPPEIGNDVAA